MKIKSIFAKTGDMRFISHLDLLRLFHRASRRAQLPITMTQGFSPRLKMSIVKALKLGVESSSEEAVFYTDKAMEPSDFMEKLNAKLPQGVNILKTEEMV